MPHVSTPDATNVFKLVEDALVGARVLVDDRLVSSTGFDKRYAAIGEDARVEVELRWGEDAPIVDGRLYSSSERNRAL